ncbi:MAG: Lrp/AsnC family transcriptional regulator [Thermodesulfovibrionia bacterium]|nr:Lrp/AsnC family transcriptional regulator [Thermodesulfovibrionia bacterium]
MKELDDFERKVVKELIRNPRISDNQIAKNVKMPVMTVNRKRKGLEEEGYLRYFTSLDTGEHGTGKFRAKQIYCVKFKIGITRKEFMDKFEKDPKLLTFTSCYISLSYLGEKDGHLAYIFILEAETESKMMDEFNSKLIPALMERFGEDCIRERITLRITNTLRLHHNYIPTVNMKGALIKKDWPDGYIFVDQENEKIEENGYKESSV